MPHAVFKPQNLKQWAELFVNSPTGTLLRLGKIGGYRDLDRTTERKFFGWTVVAILYELNIKYSSEIIKNGVFVTILDNPWYNKSMDINLLIGVLRHSRYRVRYTRRMHQVLKQALARCEYAQLILKCLDNKKIYTQDDVESRLGEMSKEICKHFNVTDLRQLGVDRKLFVRKKPGRVPKDKQGTSSS